MPTGELRSRLPEFQPYKPIDTTKIVATINGYDLAKGVLVETRPPTQEESDAYWAWRKEHAEAIARGEAVEGPLYPTEKPCENAKHCALGELLYRGGMEEKKLVKLSGYPSEWDVNDEATEILWREYGLRRYHAISIFQANDAVGEEKVEDEAEPAETQEIFQARREAVFAKVRELAESQERAPIIDLSQCDDLDEDDSDPEDGFDDDDDDDEDDDEDFWDDDDDEDDDLDDDEEDEDEGGEGFVDENQLNLMGDEEE
jgi:hypothetical protein